MANGDKMVGVGRIFGIAFLIVTFLGCENPREKGNLCLKQGDFLRAETFFKQAVDADPADLEARRGLGRALIQKANYYHEHLRDEPKNWEDALRELDLVYQLESSENLIPLLGHASYQWAKSLARQGDTALAIQSLNRLLEWNPESPSARNFAAVLHHKAGKSEKAYGLFLQNAQMDSTDATATYNLAMIHWSKKEYIQAYQWLVKAFAINPKNADVAYWVARAEKKMEAF